ncbi:MAG TPA: virulence RhuM family protein [Ferruginibacter sp.]|nr:virulence RhuM family protein [Ferruginibacter sp.]HRO06206.1 virulence RhuM family protein [Ferruginibacter sp.]HRO97379.1 virulence RhuM family protein [Ferruginibacter sp.]HRP49681.1 virulence RhuM family protein [Ferruginibacter sp.]
MTELIPNNSDFILYTSQDGEVRVDVFVYDESVWLTQKAMQDLFDRSKSTVSEHIKNVFNEGELDENQVVRKFRTTADDGKDYDVSYYNLDVIISVGYRIKSQRGTQFRIWATKTLKEFIIKGFVLDDNRLKQGGQVFGKDYFEELLERIREIRASERRFYQKITDIYSQCSIDYDANSELTQNFYKTVQNKLHWAITGNTAAEIIHKRVDSKKPNIGLTTWKNSPEGKILKSDIGIAKNYLEEKEIKELNRLVELYLNFAELQAERNIPMKMSEWIEVLDGFLKMNRYELLDNIGKISNEQAIAKASQEFEKYRVQQDKKFISDFDKVIHKIKKRK